MSSLEELAEALPVLGFRGRWGEKI